MNSYAPESFRALTFHDRPSAFRTGSDTPRDLLERCLDSITSRDGRVRAWVVLNEQ
ncbi:MAG: amidase, partial [Actinomycetia bacterium]|nr:amidase [Actinomycetes bacterium]